MCRKGEMSVNDREHVLAVWIKVFTARNRACGATVLKNLCIVNDHVGNCH